MLSVKRQIQSISGLLSSEAVSVSSSLESVTFYLGLQNFCYSEPPKQYWQILSISPQKQYPEPNCKSGCKINFWLLTDRFRPFPELVTASRLTPLQPSSKWKVLRTVRKLRRVLIPFGYTKKRTLQCKKAAHPALFLLHARNSTRECRSPTKRFFLRVLEQKAATTHSGSQRSPSSAYMTNVVYMRSPRLRT